MRRRWIAAALLFAACGGEPPGAPPLVPGLAVKGLTERERGLVLLGELGCTNCHQEDAGKAIVDARRGPDLANVGRLRWDFLYVFINDPRHTVPGTVMPDGLVTDADRAGTVWALAYYVSTQAGPQDHTESRTDTADDARGAALFARIGCAVCHLAYDDFRAQVAGKYEPDGLRAFLLAPLSNHPTPRMPDLHLLPAEVNDLVEHMVGSAPLDAVASPFPFDGGRDLFAARGCANCHRLDDPLRPAPPAHKSLKELRDGGCLSKQKGNWPQYSLSDDQGDDIQAALRTLAEPLADESRLRIALAARNCVACHSRGDFGGVDQARRKLFTGTDVALGQDGELPPTLLHAGDKLQPGWLADAIAHGQHERPYLNSRMPGYGVETGRHLAELFARADALPPLSLPSLPTDDKQRETTRELGRQLVGDKGMDCIACHAFAGERVGTMGAIDLVDSTAARLSREWFHRYLRSPYEYKPGTLMPRFFIDGKSTRPEFAGGDVDAQIDAIWQYLAEGRNVRPPDGMRHGPIELTVGEEAVVLRRAVQHTGKRGISVGYPGGVNLTFDAESLAMNQIWWGRFIDTAPVWTSQGSGEARILGKQLADLGIGPAFAQLANADAPWPTASRRQLGQQFAGYDLDAQQRPTFRYTCAGVAIADTPHEVAGDAVSGSVPHLRRTLTFIGAGDATLQFRAARHAQIRDLDGDAEAGVQVGPLRLTLTPPAHRIRKAGDQQELLVDVALQGGKAELVVDYRWEGK